MPVRKYIVFGKIIAGGIIRGVLFRINAFQEMFWLQ
jgi:hypothetical protein